MTRILAFAGKKQSGKTSAMNALVGTAMINIMLPDGFPLIPYFKIDNKGRMVIKAFDVPNEKYDPDKGEWVPCDPSEAEANFDPQARNPDVWQYMAENVWEHVKIYNFADPLKEIATSVLGLKPEQVYGTNEQKNELTDCLWNHLPIPREFAQQQKKINDWSKRTGAMSAREVMQYLGTDMMRKLKDSCWVDATINRINMEGSALALIGDCRFPNEVEGIQAAGGKVIKFTRNIHPEDNHPSEIALDEGRFDQSKFDAIIDNSKMTLDEQHVAVIQQLTEWDYLPTTQAA